MSILVVACQKGGVGKTTTFVHLAFHNQEKRKKTLLVDFDASGDASSIFSESFNGSGAISLFTSDYNKIKLQKICDNLFLLHGDRRLKVITKIPEKSVEEVMSRPRIHLQRLIKEEEFDNILIDTPPNFGTLLDAGLIASDYVLCPFSVEAFSVDGVADLFDTILEIKTNHNPQLQEIGVLVNRFDNRSKGQRQDLEELIDVLGDRMVPQVLSARVNLSDALKARKPIWKMRWTKGARELGREMRCAFDYVFAAVESR